MVGAINGLDSKRNNMADKKISVVATFQAKPGLESKVKDLLMGLIAPTRSEADCINYDLHQSIQDKALFILYENWTSKEALEEHLAMPYLKGFLAQADEILAKPVQIVLLNMISVGG